MGRVLPAAVFVFAFILVSAPALAAPLPPSLGMNEAAKQCASFYIGDECESCSMPGGWMPAEGDACPAGYEVIEARAVCTPFRTAFCCSRSHSGAQGDCDDVVVNYAERACAFIDDIEKCATLPSGWQRAPVLEALGRVCPMDDFEWLPESMECGLAMGMTGENKAGSFEPIYSALVIVILACLVAALISVLFVEKRRAKGRKR
jgi:hypothetical protein